MPISHPLQTNFTAGEFSPLLEGRVDLERYVNAVGELKNFISLPHGPAVRRWGTHYVAEVKTSAKKTRLVEFEFSDEQAYVIEFGDQYFRFYMNSGRIESPPGTAYEIVSPYAEADLFSLKFAQSADVLYIVHKNYAVRKLTRTGHTSWTISEVDFVDGPYLPEDNPSGITITPSAATGNITLTASAALFNANHVGALWRVKHGSTWGYAKITGFTSTTVVNATVKSAFGATTASSVWQEGAWSAHRGFPRAIAFWEQRLMFGGSKHQPQTVWGSKSGSFENMTPGIASDDAVTYTIGASKVNVIRWLVGVRKLLIGTVGNELCMSGGGEETPLTPTSVNIVPETSYGSSETRPIQIGNVAMFVQRSGRKIRELAYNYESDAYRAPDLSLLAEHLFKKGTSISDLDLQTEPYPIVWAVRSDGALLGMTYDRSQNVVGWHQHDTESGAGKFESLAVIPHPDGDREQVWVIVQRTVNGSTKRYVEYLDDNNVHYGADVGGMNVDSGLTYNGSPVTSVSGLGHLEGRTVAVVGDGAVQNNKTVASGAINLDVSASKIEVGLPYTSTLKTLRVEVPVAGTSQGQRKRWARVLVRVFRTLGIKVNGETLEWRSSADLMGQPPSLVSGDLEKANLGWDTEGFITVTQDQPLPATITAVTGTLDVNA